MRPERAHPGREFMRTLLAHVAAAAVVSASPAQVVTVDTVTVGNPGNPGELTGEDVIMYGFAHGNGPTRVAGAVNYTFEIATHEITAGQYTAFLNAVAATDTYGLYNSAMNLGFNNFFPS